VQKLFVALALAWVAATQTPTTWGGDHIEIELQDKGGRVEFDCARGTIDEPMRPDSKGAFRVKGTFTPERSGPIRDGDAPPALKAIYSGTIKEDAMSLRVVVESQDPAGTTYELLRGRSANLRKCR